MDRRAHIKEGQTGTHKRGRKEVGRYKDCNRFVECVRLVPAGWAPDNDTLLKSRSDPGTPTCHSVAGTVTVTYVPVKKYCACVVSRYVWCGCFCFISCLAGAKSNDEDRIAYDDLDLGAFGPRSHPLALESHNQSLRLHPTHHMGQFFFNTQHTTRRISF